MKKLLIAGLVASGFTSYAFPVLANEYADAIQDYYASSIQNWLSDPVVIDAIKAQNDRHMNMDESQILEMDKQWRSEAETGSGSLINSVTGNALSAFLSEKKLASDGLIAEMFVMDNLGMNVAVSDVTSDYWQGDEAKFQQSFGKGTDAIHIGELEFDDSSESFSTQYSITISEGGTPIGAITIGINVENL